MNYNIIRLSGIHYNDAMNEIIERIPSFLTMSYDQQMFALHDNSIMYSNSFSRCMDKLGNKSREIYYDSEILQKNWAEDEGVEYDQDNWLPKILISQIKEYKPDVIHFQGTEANKANLSDFSSVSDVTNLATILKERFPFIRLISMFVGFPCSRERLIGVDILFGGSPAIVRYLEDMDFKSSLIYHGFDDAILAKLNDDKNQDYNFSFLGSSGYTFGQTHQTRYWALMELILRTDIMLWLDERPRSNHKLGSQRNESWKSRSRAAILKKLKNFESERLRSIGSKNYFPAKLRNILKEASVRVEHNTKVDPLLPPIPLHKLFPHRCNEALYGLDMYRALKQSKLTFNIHTDVAGNSVANMRLFEATGVGTCLLSDTRENMPDLFEVDKEVVTYSTIDEAVEKVNYLLENEDVRKEIASAGQRRTLKDHTIFNRYQQIDEVIRSNL